MEQTTKPELIELYKEFQSKWPRERIASMSLEEYTKLGGKDSFCYWMEGKLSQWGSIWGGASSKFGIYEHSKNPKVDVRLCIDDQYSWYKKYGTDRNEVFEKIRKMILSIIDAVQTNHLELIDKIDMGDAYKWKIAFHYQLDIENPTLVPIYKKEWLCKLTNRPSRTEISALQKQLIAQKPQDQSVKTYSEELGKELWGVPHYWIYAPGENANMWQDCLDKGIMSIGWDDINDLADYQSKEDIKKAMQQVYQKDSSFRNDGLCCWEFANVLKEGDIIFAKNGSSKIIGRGVVTSDYRYEPERARYTHIRGVDWTNVGEWTHDTSKIVLKTLTDITKYKEYTQKLEDLVKEKPKIVGKPDMNNTEGKYNYYVQLLKEQHNIILTGAPGTGKTYLAKAIAKAMNAEVGFVQFHPSYDYTDFVEGLRPNQETEGSMGFERQDGIFKAFCSQALKNWLDAQKSKDTQNREATALKVVDEYLADCSENNIQLKTSSKGRSFYIYDSSDKCIKIRIPDNEKANDIRVSRSELVDLLVAHPHVESGSDTCAFFNRQFRTQGDTYLASIYIALSDKMKNADSYVEPITRKDFVFIIDEINRGEINKIFGELFFSLDPGYRGQAGLVQTQYQRLVPQDDLFYKGFYVPENVYIIGTMNDIDRSVESMDFAMRRRFTWVEVKPMDNAEMLEGAPWSEEAKECMVSLNKEISQTEGLGEAFQVGPSYFKKLATNGANFTTLWNMNIRPLLQEYLRGFRDATNTLAKFEAAYNRQSNDPQQETTEVVVEEAE